MVNLVKKIKKGLFGDHGSNTLFGEYFQEYAVFNPSINYMGGFNSFFKGTDTGEDLGQHTITDSAILNQFLDLGYGDLFYEASGICGVF